MEPNLQHLWMEGTDQRVAGTIRFTQKDNFLYAIEIGNEIMEMEDAPKYKKSKAPKAPYKIPGVKALDGSEIMMLGSNTALPWKQKGQDIVIEKLPQRLPCDHAWTFKIPVNK